MPAREASSGLFARMDQFAQFILMLDGWQRRGLAFLAGMIAALALAPVDFLPAYVIAFPVLVWLMDGAAHGGHRGRWAMARAAFAIGWWFGFGYFIAGLWWLGAAFIIGGAQFLWLLPLGVIGLPAVLALFFGFGLVVSRLFWSGGVARILALAFGLGLAEWARASLFTGFPWNGFGQAYANHLVLAQAVSVIGTDTLGLLTIAACAAPATLATIGRGVSRLIPTVLAVVFFIALGVFGQLRLQVAGGTRVDFATLPIVPDVKLRIMQPNIAQEEKNKPRAGANLLDQYMKLSDSARGPQLMGVSDVTHLIWPEAPLPFVLDRQPQALEALSRFLGSKTKLVTGAIRAEAMEEAQPGEKPSYRFFNAIQVYDKDGLQGSYDKAHLVPFGEYLPFDTILRALGLTQFVSEIGGFTASPKRLPVQVGGLPPVLPMICFETIFPHELEANESGEKVFINVTNDAWFGQTSGPYQHLAQARLRAIEFGQPMVRAANSGISAVFDPYGRILASLPLGVADILDSPLPQGLTTTLYRQMIWVSYGSVMICFLLITMLGVVRFSRSG